MVDDADNPAFFLNSVGVVVGLSRLLVNRANDAVDDDVFFRNGSARAESALEVGAKKVVGGGDNDPLLLLLGDELPPVELERL